ncbi:DEAD/DEAH box helicase [Bacillus wiedmannii]|uniref:type I restriction endonuclease subunit R n=1 Tax=Bacillus wiedmannii TaxID=1890302 RepID=UPI000BEF5801|nr:HsdR family type I site-specific deoxyribonuclease [Bacillus wiedmannii]PEL19435.1 DEAD/DEAH box helicase [Bacillus wiedmannii]PGZ96696.1 DEAD/DEAH box helicase [Bacillus wiedmannii]PHD24547.1 DEAD/DEAH box helicase [Bacillus wiedmannii]
MIFTKESEFENALVELLKNKGWDGGIIEYPTEADLIQNLADILYRNNKSVDRLNKVPLSKGEITQIIEQISNNQTPNQANKWINGGSIQIIRDRDSKDILHQGKTVSLKLYDRREIAAGKSHYQIVRQPQYAKKIPVAKDRRADVWLLINGLPVINIELKRSGESVYKATEQIRKYYFEGVFSGIFNLVQIFVAMTPDETRYFANPGNADNFDEKYFFNWGNFKNDPLSNWKDVTEMLLSIPMAHSMVGYYTIADDSDGILKVMRSYQYYAASTIFNQIKKTDWTEPEKLGGFIWHTTGSGKTLTSFKAAQLIAEWGNADKVVFLLDRVDLGTQSFENFKGFAEDENNVQDTNSTFELKKKMLDEDSSTKLIVTSLQKMSRISNDMKNMDYMDKITSKRIVFIVDEAHRTTFGDMLVDIKKSFTRAVFFGFTGTPIMEDNEKNGNTTADIFGSELHRYSLADGIRDKNVLGFQIDQVPTFSDDDIRQAVAFEKANAKDLTEVYADDQKKKIFNSFMNPVEVKMAGEIVNGQYKKGIEDYLSSSQYKDKDEHYDAVLADIAKQFPLLSQGNKYHAILATSSINAAVKYYQKAREKYPHIKWAAIFDPDDSNSPTSLSKIKGLYEIMADYNERYGQSFSTEDKSFKKYKKDVANRLSHRKPYQYITCEKQIDIIIVVRQLLTGFDSKWINTIYLDKMLEYADIIQTFSRTNRLNGIDKPFGNIRYYQRIHTMGKNIDKAIELYSGNRSELLYVPKLGLNVKSMNLKYKEIELLFRSNDIRNFERLPADEVSINQFVKLFNELNEILTAAILQGFLWEQKEYAYDEKKIVLQFSEEDYGVLVLRYNEIERVVGEGGIGKVPLDVPYHPITLNKTIVDSNFFNKLFTRFAGLAQSDSSKEKVEEALNELHSKFSTLTREQQDYAEIIIQDIQNGKLSVDERTDFLKLISKYQFSDEMKRLREFGRNFGLDVEELKRIKNNVTSEKNLNQYGRFDVLKANVDFEKAKKFIENENGKKLPPFKINQEIDKRLRVIILDK